MYSTAAWLFTLVILPYSSCLSLPSLTAPSRSHHNITVPSLGDVNIKCYIQPPTPGRRLANVKLEDCYTTLQYLLRGDKAMAPMRFTTASTGGFEVPFAWGHNSCAITIDNTKPRAVGTFQFVLLAHLAAEIMEGCVMESVTRLGGEAELGDQGQFQILVAGTGLVSGDWGVPGSDADPSTAVEKRGADVTDAGG
ncbi:MAG: hypothetical protein Q9218_006703 [Villophora microphyllina]